MSANLQDRIIVQDQEALAAFRKRQFDSAQFSAKVILGAIALMALALLGFWISRP